MNANIWVQRLCPLGSRVEENHLSEFRCFSAPRERNLKAATAESRNMLHPHTVTLSVHSPRWAQGSSMVDARQLVFYYSSTLGTVFVRAGMKNEQEDESFSMLGQAGT